MSLSPLAVASTLLLMLTGCSDTLQVVRSGDPPRLLRNSRILVVTPPDGAFEGAVYANSGQQTAAAAATIFAKFVLKADVASPGQLPDAALSAAASGHYTYLVYPTISHWEDRNTEWSGKPDKLAIRMVITDVATRKAVDDVTINGVSKAGTFGGDHPQDMLEPSFEKYIRTLFGEAAK